MPDETRVFDVTKPSHVSPGATSRPVIVGHQPMMSDPMVRDASSHAEATRIQVSDFSSPQPEAISPAYVTHDFKQPESHPAPEPVAETAPSPLAYRTEEPAPAAADNFDPGPPIVNPNKSFDTATGGDHPAMPETTPQSEPEPAFVQPQHIQGLHFDQKTRPRRWPKILALLIILALLGGYLLIDSGVVKSSINLPFHIFKQKSDSSSTATTSNNPAAQTATMPTIPPNYKVYKIEGTGLTFAAPLSWGDPTSVTDPGYTSRGGSNQSTGTYAYIVNFATNKDVQIAVTSSKYLPAARATLYYDYLQWCTGTNDGKFYEAVLKFTTTNKVDSPGTITCDQGPVASAVKLDSTTLLQSKAQDSAGKVIGDIYSKNLTDPSLVVFRVKDAAMTNGSDIRAMLGTIQVAPSS